MAELLGPRRRGGWTLAILLALLLAAGPAGPGAAADDSSVRRPVPGAVIRPFEAPPHPYGPGHRGVDLHAVGGEDVIAPMDGTVRFAGQVARVGWVSVDHGPGLRSTYGPLVPQVSRHQTVRAGQILGVLESDATHLDWGVLRDGEYIDPLGLLIRWRLHLTSPPR